MTSFNSNMKYCFACIVLLFHFASSFAQSEEDHLISYNKHIDPAGKLDSFKIMSMQIRADLTYIQNSTSRQIRNVRDCAFYSNGTMKCRNLDGEDRGDFEMFPIPEEYKGNGIKYQLNFIPVSHGKIFYRTKNDSITVVEKKIDSTDGYVYTFDSKTKNLLQMKTTREEEGKTAVSYTNFQSYQTVNGIVIPKTVTFSNNFIMATLEYDAVNFE